MCFIWFRLQKRYPHKIARLFECARLWLLLLVLPLLDVIITVWVGGSSLWEGSKIKRNFRGIRFGQEKWSKAAQTLGFGAETWQCVSLTSSSKIDQTCWSLIDWLLLIHSHHKHAHSTKRYTVLAEVCQCSTMRMIQSALVWLQCNGPTGCRPFSSEHPLV